MGALRVSLGLEDVKGGSEGWKRKRNQPEGCYRCVIVEFEGRDFSGAIFLARILSCDEEAAKDLEDKEDRLLWRKQPALKSQSANAENCLFGIESGREWFQGNFSHLLR